MDNFKKLSIVIPAYNEGRTIHKILDRIVQVELATQINQHLEKLLDPLVIEKATRAYSEKQLAVDTIVSSTGSRDFPSAITILKLTDTDKKILLKYILQVKTLYLAHRRDNMLERKRADETLALVVKEYNIN